MLREIGSLPRKARKGSVYCAEAGWFDQFPADWFGSGSDVPMSEDFSFCRRAAAAGFQLYADTGLECPHMIGPEFSTKALAEKHWAKKKAEFEEIERRIADAKGSADRSGEFQGLTCGDAISI
jgi:hypothetical protein